MPQEQHWACASVIAILNLRDSRSASKVRSMGVIVGAHGLLKTYRVDFIGERGGDRTHDHLIKSQMLYH